MMKRRDPCSASSPDSQVPLSNCEAVCYVKPKTHATKWEDRVAACAACGMVLPGLIIFELLFLSFIDWLTRGKPYVVSHEAGALLYPETVAYLLIPTLFVMFVSTLLTRDHGRNIIACRKRYEAEVRSWMDPDWP